MRKLLLLLLIVPMLCGWTKLFTKCEDFTATNQLTNDSTHGAQIRANYYEGQNGYETRGTWTGLQGVYFNDGDILYYHVENYVPTGFSSASQEPTVSAKKWLRIQGMTANGEDVGYWSLMAVGNGDRTSIRPWADLEPVELSLWRGTDTLPTCPLDTWVSWDQEIKLGTNNDGYVILSALGTTRTQSGIDTYAEAGEDTARGQFSTDTVKFSTVYFQSTWNGDVYQDTYMYFRNIYISNERSYADYIGGVPASDTTAPTASEFSPAQSATGVATDSNIIYYLNDSQSGIDSATVVMTVEGIDVSGDLAFGSDLSNMSVTWTNDQSWTNEQVINVVIDADDNDGNSMTQVVYSFTTDVAAAPGSPVFAAGATGTRDNYTELNSDRWSVVDEGANDVYKINTTVYNPIGSTMGEYTLYNTANDRYIITLKCRSDENLVTNTYGDYCIVLNYVSADDYIMVMFNADAGSNGVYRCLNGEQYPIYEYAGALVDDNDWHDIEITIENQVLTVYFDTVQVMQVDSYEFGNYKWGFGSYNDAASFDDVTVTPYPPSSAPPPNTGASVRTSGSSTITTSGTGTITAG